MTLGEDIMRIVMPGPTRQIVRRAAAAAAAAAVAAVVPVAVLAAPAGADATCYTGCPPTSAGGGTLVTATGAAALSSPAPATAAADSGSGVLAFTGADIAEMAAVGGVGVVGGSLLLARGRRRARART